MRIYILATTQHDDVSAGESGDHYGWVGEVGWPSVPPEGATWVHCGDYPGETVDRVYWCGPGDDLEDAEGYAPVQILVRVTDPVIEHLLIRHGFREVGT